MDGVDLSGKKVAILVYDNFEQIELTSPQEALENAGVTTEIVSSQGPKITGMKHLDKGDEFEVDVALDDAKVENYDAIVVPGGVANGDFLRTEEKARNLINQFNDQGKPMAVICHGPWLLVSSGLADERKLTSYHTLQDDIRNAGGEWVNQEVVVDGNLVTSRNPDDLPAFNEEIVKKLATE